MPNKVLAGLFPERNVANFVHRDERHVFFSLLSELAEPHHTVVDFGAGRGLLLERGGRHLRTVSNLKGRCRRLIGVDVATEVMRNPALDEAMVVEPGGAIPLPDNSADIVYSYAVFEHVADPEPVASELQRILKPGGWLCAWTPNKWGYVGIGARLIPNRHHARVLDIVSPQGRGEQDVFPVAYRMNTRQALRRLFPRLEDHSFGFNGQPSYNFGSPLVARLLLMYMALTPRSLAKSLMVFMRKPDEAEAPVG